VGQKMSHVSKKFAAGDAEFWAPATIPAAGSGKSDKAAAPRNTAAPSPKP
jgi:hypothetical protein